MLVVQRCHSDQAQFIDDDRGRLISQEAAAGLAVDRPQARGQLRQPAGTQPLPGRFAHC
jgi:hypothetical protein